jgi:5-formyltetrahydrofolate cyclo-ligase
MSATLQEKKRELRREMSRRRRAVSPDVAAKSAFAAAAALLATKPAKRARHIALYAALPGEIPTRLLFDAVVKERGAALLPRSLDPIGLAFFSVTRWEDLRPG